MLTVLSQATRDPKWILPPPLASNQQPQSQPVGLQQRPRYYLVCFLRHIQACTGTGTSRNKALLDECPPLHSNSGRNGQSIRSGDRAHRHIDLLAAAQKPFGWVGACFLDKNDGGQSQSQV